MVALQNALSGTGSTILSAWQFSTTNYPASNPAYISLPIGGAYDADQLAVYHFDGVSWSRLTNLYDLNTDGTYANFTASATDEYAVVIPEPAFGFLFAAGTGLLSRRRAKGRRAALR